MSEVADIINNHEHKPPETSESETCPSLNGKSENKIEENGIASIISEDANAQGGKVSKEQNVTEEQEIEKSFWCDICEKDLNTEGAWTVHNKFAHPNRVLTVTSGQKPEPKEVPKPQKFWCETCEKELNSVATWNVHNKFAHGIEPPNNQLLPGSKSSSDNKNDEKGRMRKSSFMILLSFQGLA